MCDEFSPGGNTVAGTTCMGRDDELTRRRLASARLVAAMPHAGGWTIASPFVFIIGSLTFVACIFVLVSGIRTKRDGSVLSRRIRALPVARGGLLDDGRRYRFEARIASDNTETAPITGERATWWETVAIREWTTTDTRCTTDADGERTCREEETSHLEEYGRQRSSDTVSLRRTSGSTLDLLLPPGPPDGGWPGMGQSLPTVGGLRSRGERERTLASSTRDGGGVVTTYEFSVRTGDRVLVAGVATDRGIAPISNIPPLWAGGSGKLFAAIAGRHVRGTRMIVGAIAAMTILLPLILLSLRRLLAYQRASHDALEDVFEEDDELRELADDALHGGADPTKRPDGDEDRVEPEPTPPSVDNRGDDAVSANAGASNFSDSARRRFDGNPDT